MRKCALPSELSGLTDEQLTELDSWLDRFTYAKVQELFFGAHKIAIGRMKLARYNGRRLKARALSQAGQPSLTAADLVAIQNGTAVPEGRLNKDFLLRRPLQMVPQVTSAFHLRELHQIATYEERRDMNERDQVLRQKQLALRDRVLEFRRQREALKQSNQSRP